MRHLWAVAAIFGLLPAGRAQEPETKAAPSLSGAALIDQVVQQQLKEAGFTAAKLSDDAEFLRRITLDILGTVPAPDDVVAFARGKKSDKRAAKINELLETPQYAHNWAELWEDILLGYGGETRRDSKRTLFYWLRDECFGKNLPYDQMVHTLITAKGVTTEFGPVNFLMKYRREGTGAVDMVSKASKTFLGIQIQCAQCHDHPFDKWTQDEFYGMVGFFARTNARKVSEDREDRRQELFDGPRGEAQYGEGNKRKTVAPVFFIDGSTPAGDNRREEFARLLVRPENPQFARAIVNRLWNRFFGRGIVHPHDDFNGRNKPTHPEILDGLARQFIAQKYDLKWLIRAIANSKTYQQSSKKPKNAPPEKYFAYAQTRPLAPEQIYNAIMEATGQQELFEANRKKGEADTVQNRKDQALSMFRRNFGDDENVDAVDFDGTIPQALMLMNGQELHKGIVDKNNRLDLILRTRKDGGERLTLIFLSVLGRYPTAREANIYSQHLDHGHFRREAFEDVFWVLLNSSEFLFNH